MHTPCNAPAILTSQNVQASCEVLKNILTESVRRTYTTMYKKNNTCQPVTKKSIFRNRQQLNATPCATSEKAVYIFEAQTLFYTHFRENKKGRIGHPIHPYTTCSLDSARITPPATSSNRLRHIKIFSTCCIFVDFYILVDITQYIITCFQQVTAVQENLYFHIS